MITNAKDVNAASTRMVDWETIDWDSCQAVVKKLQVRIAKAVQKGNYRKVKALQWLLTHSFSAKAMAVKQVMQNQGKHTPGVDGVVLSTPQQKATLLSGLKRRNYQPKPLRRVYIPKSNQKLRPLGIPTIKDRAMQALHTLALVPVGETTADKNSYGFRLQRGCADAIEHLFKILARKNSPQWVLEGDIKGCFDHISHSWMLDHICMDKVLLEKWLKAGYVEKRKLFPTMMGSPQGGIISPALSNLVLDGMEKLLKKEFGNRPIGINVIRYADDFIITAKTKEVLEERVKPLVINFLKARGLELSLDKTKTTHIKEGFNFLGQNLRKYPNGNHKDKLLIKPAKENGKTFLAKIRKCIRESQSLDQVTLITLLNPKIRGWANYHRSVVAKEIFASMDHYIWQALWQWVKRKHPQKPAGWVLNKYYHYQKLANYCFSGLEKLKDGSVKRRTLLKMSQVPIRRHILIRKEANPFDRAYEEYFEGRKSDQLKHTREGQRVAEQLIKRQNNLCLCCGQRITARHRWRIHLHKRASKGGGYQLENLCLIHDRCHKEGFENGFAYITAGYVNKA